MTTLTAETNLQIYDTAEVASHYASLDHLTPCEQVLFNSYIQPGGAVLDLGVGGGRTTSWLAPRASQYLGVDYAPAMVEACQEKFPNLEFLLGDAADLSRFEDAHFDTVVFSFNGIDYVLPAASRRACLEHIHRVLKANGVFILSAHNPRAFVRRQSLNRERLQHAARRFSAQSGLQYELWLAVLIALRWFWACLQALSETVANLSKRIFTRAFWRGEGEIMDTAHGGLLTHCWMPSRAIDEISSFGLRIERVLGNEYPRSSWTFATGWYYYVFTKSSTRVPKSCA